jgi:hypothetical protein
LHFWIWNLRELRGKVKFKARIDVEAADTVGCLFGKLVEFEVTVSQLFEN